LRDVIPGSHEPSWLDKFKAPVRAWIARTSKKIFGRVEFPISWQCNRVTLVALVGLLLAFWTVRSVMILLRDRKWICALHIRRQDWRYWAREAREAAERGDYRAAIHAAY